MTVEAQIDILSLSGVTLLPLLFSKRTIDPFLHDVTAAIFVYKTINRRPRLCIKKILWELNFFHMLKLFFFQAICKAADHVTENDLYLLYRR